MVGPLSWDLEVLRPERLQTQRCSGRKVLRVGVTHHGDRQV